MNDKKKNLELLRQMLNQEVNSAMFNPDIRDHTPHNVIVIIENEDGHIHCIQPDDVDVKYRMFRAVLNGEVEWLHKKGK